MPSETIGRESTTNPETRRAGDIKPSAAQRAADDVRKANTDAEKGAIILTNAAAGGNHATRYLGVVDVADGVPPVIQSSDPALLAVVTGDVESGGQCAFGLYPISQELTDHTRVIVTGAGDKDLVFVVSGHGTTLPKADTLLPGASVGPWETAPVLPVRPI